MNERTKNIERREFLSRAGLTISLPFLNSAFPGSLRAKESALETHSPKKLACVSHELGIYPKGFFPETDGAGYEMPFLLEPLEPHRDSLTIFSHLEHPGVGDGHQSTHTFLSGIHVNDAQSAVEGNISLDQKCAELTSSPCRYSSLTIGNSEEASWTRNSSPVPPIFNVMELYDLLFEDSSSEEVQRKKRLHQDGTSIIDSQLEGIKRIERKIGSRDKSRLEQFLVSIREVEEKMERQIAWIDQPKPETDFLRPDSHEDELAYNAPIFYDLMALALQTHSTHVITYGFSIDSDVRGLPGVDMPYHPITHHGKNERFLKQLFSIEGFNMRQFSRFLSRLAETEMENGRKLLDETLVLMGSGMGNASSHSCRDLPILLAGGGLSSHGAHRRFTEEKDSKVPLCNLYVSMMQHLGHPIDRFGSSNGTIDLS